MARPHRQAQSGRRKKDRHRKEPRTRAVRPPQPDARSQPVPGKVLSLAQQENDAGGELRAGAERDRQRAEDGRELLARQGPFKPREVVGQDEPGSLGAAILAGVGAGVVAAVGAPAVLALATDKVRYVGDPIALVVAEDRYVAEDAVEVTGAGGGT